MRPQFKQRYLKANLYLFQYKLKLKWHYFATGHGKGMVDGIGGSVKGAVQR